MINPTSTLHFRTIIPNFNDIHELKTMMKGLFDQLGSTLNLLTTVLAKLT
jgi:hypothetical protein